MQKSNLYYGKVKGDEIFLICITKKKNSNTEFLAYGLLFFFRPLS